MIKEPLIIESSYPSKGGLRALPFILANQGLERLASFGLLPNMILYLTTEYGMEASQGANVLFFWSAATNLLPIFGAFLADSYVGRFPMIGFGSIASLLGTILLWSTTIIPKAKPTPCDGDTCQSATALQLLLLYSSFGLISIGAGGVRSSALAFSADQLIMEGKKSSKNTVITLESLFSWYYVVVCVSVVIGMTCVVYIQEVMGWKVGFGAPVLLMILSTFSFFLASPFYVKSKPKTSLLTGFAQVLVAAYKKRNIPFSQFDTDQMYHSNGSMLRTPTEKLRFLNKACMVENPEVELSPDGRALDPWSLCTIDQVEELKAVARIIPIWSTGIIIYITVSQSSFPVLQASTMNRHITSNFEIPAGSIGVFMILSIVIWISFYNRLIIPFTSKLIGKPAHLSSKQRMGIGILLSSASMAAAAISESFRREMAIKEGFLDNPNAVVNMSVLWLLPRNILEGLAQAFNTIGQNEFYYTELPKCMSSISVTLSEMGLAAANLVASLIMTCINSFTRGEGGEESWVSSNINKGHYDYYYWLLAVMSLLNFVYYIACSKNYGPCKEDRDNNSTLNEGLLGNEC